ncbi:MAG: hypothetical protein ACI8RU_000713 [Zhongshania aliphaticivorans]|mgnify:CR=1 FL=1|uniref:hypothetical protein n=1 Tax=Zhongshania aliphaticivorans TaxID=1470434 RepID=UPI0039E55DD4
MLAAIATLGAIEKGLMIVNYVSNDALSGNNSNHAKLQGATMYRLENKKGLPYGNAL